VSASLSPSVIIPTGPPVPPLNFSALKDLSKQPTASGGDYVVEEGTLCVRVISAQRLPEPDTLGTCDPYVLASIGNHRRKTRVAAGTRDPEWGEEVELPLRLPVGDQVLVLQVMAHDRFTDHDVLATSSLPLGSLLGPDSHGTAVHRSLSLTPAKGEAADATLQVEVSVAHRACVSASPARPTPTTTPATEVPSVRAELAAVASSSVVDAGDAAKETAAAKDLMEGGAGGEAALVGGDAGFGQGAGGFGGSAAGFGGDAAGFSGGAAGFGDGAAGFGDSTGFGGGADGFASAAAGFGESAGFGEGAPGFGDGASAFGDGSSGFGAVAKDASSTNGFAESSAKAGFREVVAAAGFGDGAAAAAASSDAPSNAGEQGVASDGGKTQARRAGEEAGEGGAAQRKAEDEDEWGESSGRPKLAIRIKSKEEIEAESKVPPPAPWPPLALIPAFRPTLPSSRPSRWGPLQPPRRPASRVVRCGRAWAQQRRLLAAGGQRGPED